MKQIVHIGANKTASTLLQRRLFANHPSINYLGEDCQGYDEMQSDLETLIQRDDSYYKEEKMMELFRERSAEKSRPTMVFSSEDILTARHPSVCAARLGRLMPDAEVVLVVRNQLSTWPSWYINHGAYLKGVPRRYWRRHVGFEEWLDYCFSYPDQTPVEAMNYWRHWEIFSSVFGKDRVKVLFYEDLLGNPSSYYQQWAELLSIPTDEVASRLEKKRERSRYSQRRFHFDRWKAAIPLLGSSLEKLAGPWLDQGRAAEVALPVGWENQIQEYYADGNRALEAATGLPLKQYGYPI